MKQLTAFLWKRIDTTCALPMCLPLVLLAFALLSSAFSPLALAQLTQSSQQPDGRAPRAERPDSGIGRLELSTSDNDLAAAFAWARQQALAYAFSGDAVGDWYEAALPGREAF